VPDSGGKNAVLKRQSSSTGHCTFEIRSPANQEPRRLVLQHGTELSVPVDSKEAWVCATAAEQVNWSSCDQARLELGVFVHRHVSRT